MKQVKRPTPTGNAGAGLAFTLSGSAPVSEKAKQKATTSCGKRALDFVARVVTSWF
jgi:hypothetical protein